MSTRRKVYTVYTLLSRCVLALAWALLSPRVALAQDADAGALPPGHPPVQSPHGEDGQPHQSELPPTFAEESPMVPPGVVLVRVVDARGEPVAGVEVRLGSTREGARGDARTAPTDGTGVTRFEGLPSGNGVAYRVSTERDGARFSTEPFQLAMNAGHRAQLVRYDVDRAGRAVLLWDARTELRFKDDRLVVVHRLNVVNLSGMSLGERAPRPVAFVPEAGLRFALPRGFTAFTPAPSMSDVRITEEGGAAVLRGSIPPTGTEPLELAYQYQLPLSGGELTFTASLALPVVGATVATEAPPGLTLSVDGFPAAQAQDGRGERVLLTSLERRPSDPPLRELRIRLGGVPRATGPARWIAALTAGLVVLSALYGALRGPRAGQRRSRQELERERDRVLAEARELTRAHKDGDVGPKTYARRRQELARWLATLLRELDQAGA